MLTAGLLSLISLLFLRDRVRIMFNVRKVLRLPATNMDLLYVYLSEKLSQDFANAYYMSHWQGYENSRLEFGGVQMKQQAFLKWVCKVHTRELGTVRIPWNLYSALKRQYNSGVNVFPREKLINLIDAEKQKLLETK